MIQRRFHWAWVVLAVCFLDLFVNYSIRLGFGVVLPEMIRSLSLSRTQGGAIYNFYLAAYICMTPFTGNLTDRFGARRIITAFCVLLGIGTLLMGTSSGFIQASIFFALVGIGGSAMWTPVITVVQHWFAPERRGMALGILSTGYGLGFAAMGWLFPILVASFSWRLCWYVLGGAALLMVVVNGILLRSNPSDINANPWGQNDPGDDPSPSVEKPAHKGSFSEVFSFPEFWMIGISYFFAACGLYVITTFMVDYANLELGFGYKSSSLLATIHGLSQVVGVLTIPMLSDRIGRRTTLVGTNGFIALAIVGVLISGGSLLGLYASVAVLGIFYGATWPMYGACAGDYFRREVMGTVIGAWTPFYGLGAILAHFIAGAIRDITGSFRWAFMLAIVFAIVASFLMGRLKEPKKYQQSQ